MFSNSPSIFDWLLSLRISLIPTSITTVLDLFACPQCVHLNPFMSNVVKWPNVLIKSCDVNTSRFFKICLAILQHYARKC